MAGFFKKLFNRIAGRPGEEPTPEAAQPAALPAPEVQIEPPVVASVEVATKPKKAEARKPAQKKEPAKKPSVKKSAKPEPKAPPPKKPAAKPIKPEPVAPPPKPKAMPVSAPAPVVPAPPVLETEVQKLTLEAEIEAPVPTPVVPPAVTDLPQASGWLSRLRQGLSKSSKSISGSITSIFTKKKLDRETLQDLEDTLIQADLGLPVAERIIAQVSHGRYDKEIDPEEVKRILAAEVSKVLKPVEVPFNFGAEKPFVIMVVGVNGAGKTTTIGKLGSIAKAEGFKVMFAACDTFRAAAIEQLTVWGQRIGAETMSRPTGADAAGLAFDAMKQAKDTGIDILFVDTAGRLQNKAYLMDELDKVVRVVKKLDPSAPHAVLLVLDATTGQNALAQAEVFTKVAGVTGLIMTKLDGTARGGILVAIADKFKLPIHAIGVGEQIEDLQPFDADGFARAIAGLDE